MEVRVAIVGRNYHAAQDAPAQLALPEGATVDDALEALAAFLPPEAALDGACLVAVSGTHVGTVRAHAARVLRDGDELLILAPVAGG